IKYIRAISFEDGSVKMFSNNDCRFSYRDSIFKSELKGKYLITRVFYHLYRNRKYNLSHVLLKEEVEKSSEISLRSLREAVIRIRKRKLPGPDEPGNAGSFFKNPVVPSDFAEFLRSQYPDMPFYPDPSGGFKLAAGWLIEQCGWKGKRIGDAGVYEKQALILVNHGRATGREILELSEMIQNSVYEKFGIMLEREVEVIQ
ncbi:MAG: UDP-N-acetylmuramate dehydrogenase, partial [Bacteroidales bacterium]